MPVKAEIARRNLKFAKRACAAGRQMLPVTSVHKPLLYALVGIYCLEFDASMYQCCSHVQFSQAVMKQLFAYGLLCQRSQVNGGVCLRLVAIPS